MNNYFMETHNHEWILSNRQGSYALGTGNLVNQRKYHGLLIASKDKLVRQHLVAGIEEKVEWRGESFFMDSTNYSNCIYPEGFLHLVKPWLRPYPIFLYSALPHQNEILVRKEIMMDQMSNSTMIKYTNLGKHPLQFELLPKFTMCPHHNINRYGSLDFVDFEQIIQEKKEQSSLSLVRKDNGISVHAALQYGEIKSHRSIYRKVYYPWEVMNGYEGVGDQIALFQLKFTLAPGQTNHLVFSDSPIEDMSALVSTIEKRYENLPMPKDYPAFGGDDDILGSLDYEDEALYSYEDYLKILRHSLNDFILKDDVVSGYPYYGIWGRDTMFVLEALLDSGEDLAIISEILGRYSKKIKDGLLPNMHYEGFDLFEYQSIDVTLLYVHLICELALKKNDPQLYEEMIYLAESLLLGIYHNEKYDFSIGDDGLIYLGARFGQCTWMNAVIENEPVTPRDGAPIEVNAHWYNAIVSYLEIIAKHKSSDKPNEVLVNMKDKLDVSMQKYWNDVYLADRILDGETIFEMRPNAVIALSLKHSPFGVDVFKQVYNLAFDELYTFYGLRTLSTKDHRFRKKYYGDQHERDLAYHNGSVWAWLFDPFCKLYVKAFGGERNDHEMQEVLSELITVFRKGFMKGHIASIAEVWDGDMPHFPKGAPAKAISVAAVYSIENMINSLGGQA